MNKKIAVVVVIIIVIILASLAVINLVPTKKLPYYSDDPKTWVDKKTGGIEEVNVDKITEGAAYVGAAGIQYESSAVITAFDYMGFYRGESFREIYRDENDKILMKITPEMKPGDGIIEGFIVEKIADNNAPVIYIFLDTDWKQKVGKTYIYWGTDYKKTREFNFTEISKGIYMDSVKDDPSRFIMNYTMHVGGIIVGDISPEKLENEDEDITIMKFV